MYHATLRPIDQLATDWKGRSRSPDSRLALQRLAAAEELVAAVGATDLGDLVAALGRSGSTADRVRSAKLLQAMLRSQRVHPLVPRAILQALLPGLVATARRLSWGSGGDWEGAGSFLADTVATAWEVIVEWAGQDRDYAVLDLLSATRCRLRRQLLHQRASRQRAVTGLDMDTCGKPKWDADISDLDELARHIEDLAAFDGDPVDAAVLYGNRVLGYSVTELARMSGRSRRFVATRRDRAVQKLFA